MISPCVPHRDRSIVRRIREDEGSALCHKEHVGSFFWTRHFGRYLPFVRSTSSLGCREHAFSSYSLPTYGCGTEYVRIYDVSMDNNRLCHLFLSSAPRVTTGPAALSVLGAGTGRQPGITRGLWGVGGCVGVRKVRVDLLPVKPRSARVNSNALQSRQRYTGTVAQPSFRANTCRAYTSMGTTTSLPPEEMDG